MGRFRLVLMVVGSLMILVSILADVTGLGTGSGFGWKQITAVSVGTIILILGFVLKNRPSPPGNSK